MNETETSRRTKSRAREPRASPPRAARAFEHGLERSPYLTLGAAAGLGFVAGGGLSGRLLTGIVVLSGRALASAALQGAVSRAIASAIDDESTLANQWDRIPRSSDLLALLGLERRSESDSLISALASFGAGLAIGTALVLLITPKSGEEIRRESGDQVNRFREGMRGARPAAES